MSEQRTLRDLVTERLTLAAEEIFALFERTIVEYEEELCRWREESQRKPQSLDLVVDQTKPVSPPPAPGLCLNQGATEFKEEQKEELVKEEEEHPSVSLSSGVCLKSEDPPLLLQIHTEQREAHITTEPPFQSQTEGHGDFSSNLDANDDYDWEHQRNCSAAAYMEAHHYPTLIPGISPAAALNPAVSAQFKSGNMLDRGPNRRNHLCYICQKGFRRKMELERHIRVHTGERPYSCSVCAKTFSQKIHLEVHMRTHSSEKPYSCPVCTKTFTQKVHLEVHLRTHTGERPYCCPACGRTFTQKVYLQKHMLTHTGETS